MSTPQKASSPLSTPHSPLPVYANNYGYATLREHKSKQTAISVLLITI
ncbi:hypothetical protein [Nostoc sp.]